MLFRPARASDVDEICALLASATRGPAYVHALLRADRCFDPGQFRVAWTHGRIIACARAAPRAVRLGSMTVPAATIGLVRTDSRYWGKRLTSSLLAECATALSLEGRTLAPLVARRHDLFARHGWHAVPRIALQIPVDALRAPHRPRPVVSRDGDVVGAPLRVHEAPRADLDGLVALHAEANAERTGTAVRDRDAWLTVLDTLALRGGQAFVATRAGRTVGYAAAYPDGENSERVEASELLLAPGDEAAWRPLLGAVADKFGAAATIHAVLPADYRARIAGALGPEVTMRSDDTLMLRAIDPARLLRDITPLLEARLNSAPTFPPSRVRVGPLRGGVTLCVAGGRVVVEPSRRDDPHALPEPALGALALGAGDVDAYLSPDAPPELRATLGRLFPPQDWTYWRADAL